MSAVYEIVEREDGVVRVPHQEDSLAVVEGANVSRS